MLRSLKKLYARTRRRILSDPLPPAPRRPGYRPLPLPDGFDEETLRSFVVSVRVEDAPEAEMRAYGTHDFRRFVYTWGMASEAKGRCLELGANPYFTTMLLDRFTSLELSLANYFGPSTRPVDRQTVTFRDPKSGTIDRREFEYRGFNVEVDPFPYERESFEVVVFAEIIEHLLEDPSAVLRKIHDVLVPGGTLLLTTPNVSRLENVARMIAGTNIYDPYSGYGAYGRHNREYNRHELVALLTHEGFEIVDHFTADVHPDVALDLVPATKLLPLVQHRAPDLGQYVFVKARKSGPVASRRPAWLYRSYPSDQLD